MLEECARRMKVKPSNAPLVGSQQINREFSLMPAYTKAGSQFKKVEKERERI